MVDGTPVSVHRCRFVDFTPAAITALAFPPLPLPSVKGKRSSLKHKNFKFGGLAVGRANGNIELYDWTGSDHQLQASQAWVVKKTLPGPFPSKVDSLALSLRTPYDLGVDDVPSWSDLRLFSAGGGNELAEWDIERGCVRRTLPSQGGAIWSISVNPASTMLALGCEDGSIRIISLEDDTLVHLKRLDRAKSRILSLAWGPPIPRDTKPKTSSDSDSDSDDENNDWNDSWIVAGCSDSSIRKWDLTSGRISDRMGTDKMRGERTLVWAVGVLGDGTIISGDSLGMVKFWDSRTCTQLQSFQAHGADVLCLTISPEGTAVYTSGVDQKVIQFTHIKTSTTTTQSSLLSRSPARWVQSSSRRLHSHDVRALAIWPPYSPLPNPYKRQFPLDIAPILASGGLDMSVVVTPSALPSNTLSAKVVNPLSTSVVATFEDSYHRRLAYTSGAFGGSAVCLARKARLLVCMRDAGISVWRILKRKREEKGGLGDDEDTAGGQEEGYEHVLDMDLNVHSNLVACAISDNGEWLFVSDWYESKLFHLESNTDGDSKPKRIRDLTSIIQSQLPNSKPSTPTGASTVVFTPDNTKLIIATSISSYILVLDLSSSSDNEPKVIRRFEQHRTRNVVVGERVVKKLPGAHTATTTNEEDDDVQMDGGEGEDNVDESDNDFTSSSALPSSNSSKPLTATITRLAVSPDGQWLLSTDTSSHTHVFNLDSLQHHSILPSFPISISTLSFSPNNPNILIIGLSNNEVWIYDVEEKTFPGWGKGLLGLERLKGLKDEILGVTFDSGGGLTTKKSPTSALFWGSTWLCKIQLDGGSKSGLGSSNRAGFDKKRRRDRDGKRHPPHQQPLDEHSQQTGQQNFKLITHYRPILFVDFIEPGELVVVERPLVDVLAKLPPPYFKPKYGAS
ncbi:WD40 repeat-like protein [Abortiporus biennis]|nr:WD40 repeat-like protein [Abortiporus biennis]